MAAENIQALSVLYSFYNIINDINIDSIGVIMTAKAWRLTILMTNDNNNNIYLLLFIYKQYNIIKMTMANNGNM